MISASRTKIISNFFLDGAKILFGSLVVGAFMPSAIELRPPYFTVGLGIVFTIIFFVIADALAKIEEVT